MILLPSEYPEVLEAEAKALAEAKKAAEEDENAPPVQAPSPKAYTEIAPSKIYAPFQSAYTAKQLEEMAKMAEKARELAERESAAAAAAAAENGSAEGGDNPAGGMSESVSALSLGTMVQDEVIPEGDEVDELMVAAFKAVDVFSSSLGADSPKLWSSIYPQGVPSTTAAPSASRSEHSSSPCHMPFHLQHPFSPPLPPPPTFFRLGRPPFLQPVRKVCGQALGGWRLARCHDRRPDARGRKWLPGRRELEGVA